MTLPIYDIYEPISSKEHRYIGEAWGIEAAERAAKQLLDEQECEVVHLWLDDRKVETAMLNADGVVLFTTLGQRRDLR